MTRINTNVPSLVARQRLHSSNADLSTALNRLSTGLKINRGADDPGGLIARDALRTEITGINRAISNTHRASQIISTTDSALGQVGDLLTEVRGLVVEASNAGAISEEEVAANQLQIDSSLEAINRIAQTTTFQGRKLLDGSQDFLSTIGNVSSVTDATIEQATLGAGGVDVQVEIESAAERASISVDDSAFDIGEAATHSSALSFNTFTIDAGGEQLQIAGDFSSVELIDDAGLDGTATASLNAGKLTITIDSGESSFFRDIDAIADAVEETGLGFEGFGSNVPTAFVETATTGVTTGEFRVTRSDGGEFSIQYTESGATDSSASYDANSNTLTVDIGSDDLDGDLIDTEIAIDGLATGLGFSFESELVDDDDNPLSSVYGEVLVPAADYGNGLLSTPTLLKDDLVFQINGKDGAETFRFGAGTKLDQIVAAVNLVSDSTGVQADSTNGLTFTSTAYGSDALVNVDVISEGSKSGFSSALSANRVTGRDIVATINGTQASAQGNTFSINTASLDVTLSVEDGISTDFGFSITGGGAQFQLGSGVRGTQQARLGIGSVSTGQLGGAAGRLYELGSGQAKSLANDANGAAKLVDEVISLVSQTRGRLGAFQSTTLASNLTTLNQARANLQEAESSISDADFAQESAQLTRAQILVQSGTNVLALANQNPQNVLSLLR